ncbi:MFS transporter [Amycolatopsis silviterrae]|uniref:MFS transporter n=1 Tax=Amycolatopsis silviterrae TaxID=1656914 RepID=A0ABW5HH10_9PSEU
MSVQGRIAPAEAATKRRGKVLTAAIAAQSLEYYDFLIYGTAASLVFNHAFFPSTSAVAGVLAAFATFAVGFAGRPVGAAVFGHIGDRFGRKPALVASTLSMAVATTLVGLLPTFSSIGALAPVLLVILRVAQGIAVGGVWGGSTLLAVEHAPPNRRGLHGSLPQLGIFAGMVLGTLVFVVLSGALTADQFAAWGWRIPFLLGIVMIPVVFYIHRYLEDSPDFRAVEEKLAAAPKRSSVVQVLRRPKNLLLVVFIFLPATIMFYATVTGLLDYGVRELKIAKGTMLTAVMFSMIATGVSTVLCGRLSDTVGRRPVYAGGVVLAGIWGFALFPLADTRNFWAILLAIVVGQISVGAMFGPGVTMFAEMFPPSVRFSGASMGYQLANIIGGGLAPFVMAALIAATHTTVSVSVYILAACLISLVPLALLGRRALTSAAVEG